MTTDLRSAYDASATSWAAGPDRVFGALAAALVGIGPDWEGAVVADVGAGTGTATRLLRRQGARVVAVDASAAMLAHVSGGAVVGDLAALPLRDAAVDGAVAGFVLSHLDDPAAGVAELARVVRPGGTVLASTWAHDDGHPIRTLVEAELLAAGWAPPSWYRGLKDTPMAHVDGLRTAAACLADVEVTAAAVPVALTPEELVEWRLGMPHTAPFLAGCPDLQGIHDRLTSAARALPPLVCRVLLLRGTVSEQ